jgi:hypothetical protein
MAGGSSPSGRFGDFLLFFHAAKSWWKLDPSRWYTNDFYLEIIYACSPSTALVIFVKIFDFCWYINGYSLPVQHIRHPTLKTREDIMGITPLTLWWSARLKIGEEEVCSRSRNCRDRKLAQKKYEAMIGDGGEKDRQAIPTVAPRKNMKKWEAKQEPVYATSRCDTMGQKDRWVRPLR